MDPFERAPVNYGRDAVQVISDGRRVPAWTCFANPAVRREGFPPPRACLAHLPAGRDYLTPGCFQWLQGLDCVA